MFTRTLNLTAGVLCACDAAISGSQGQIGAALFGAALAFLNFYFFLDSKPK